MATMAFLSGFVQAVAMSIVVCNTGSSVVLQNDLTTGANSKSQAYLAKNDEKFAVPGWYLDQSWDMCTASWTMQIVVAIAITLAALCLPSEGGYELIPDRLDDEEQ